MPILAIKLTTKPFPDMDLLIAQMATFTPRRSAASWIITPACSTCLGMFWNGPVRRILSVMTAVRPSVKTAVPSVWCAAAPGTGSWVT